MLIPASSAGQPVVVIGQCCLIASILAPVVGATAGSWPQTGPTRGARIAAGFSGLAAISALALCTTVALHGPIAAGLGREDGGPVLGVDADHLTVTLLALVCCVGALVQSYAVRHLRADARAHRFFVGAGVLVSSSALVATSSTASGVVAGWVVAGWAFVFLVGYRTDLPGTNASAHRARRMFLVGDGALVSALALLVVRAGNVDLAGRGPDVAARHLGGAGTAVALLVVVAALTRCAQGPLGVWLPGTVAAPTPVSALLHAGFVNGGGILLVRFGVLSSGSLPAMAVAFSVAVLTTVGASAVMSCRPDVKGALAFSTMSQMGFMIAEVSVGAPAAAMVHLIGHAIYKATSFLGSGGVVRRQGSVSAARDPGFNPTRLVLAVTAGAAAAGTVAVVPGLLDRRGGTVLLAFVAATAGVSAWAWSVERGPTQVVRWTASLLAGSALYGLLAGGIAAWLQPALPPGGAGLLDPWLLLVVAAGGATLELLGRTSRFGTRLRVLLVHAGAPSRDPGIASRRVPVSTRATSSARPGEWIGHAA